MHVSFQVLGSDKQTLDQGTIEVWWAGARQFRIAFQARSLHSEVYFSDGRTVTIGDQGTSTYPVNLLLAALRSPLPDEAWISSMNLALQHATLNGEEMVCVAGHSPLDNNPKNETENCYCFERASPALRLAELSGSEYNYDALSEFDGRWVAHTLRITSQGNFAPEVDARIDSLDELDPIPPGTFTPPLHAGTSGIPIEASVMAGKKIAGENPKYPSSAKKKRIQGTVVLLARIDKEGKISNLEVVSGPPELQEPSVEAVRNWRYTPYLLNGQPVEIETQISVNFALGR